MKKMKRFLSLLLCMVMLMSILPMSAVAAGPGPEGPEGPGQGPDGAGYTVTFVPDNGTDEVFSLVTKADGKLEAKDKPKDISKNGYTFDGWYVVTSENDSIAEDAAKVDLGKKFDKDTCLKAKWIPKEYQVEFDGNGAKGKMDPQRFTYDQMQSLTPNAFEKEGYTFTGWNTKKDGSGDSYGDCQEVENLAEQGKVKLFAQWKKADDPAPPADDTCVVTFDMNGNGTNFTKTVKKGGTVEEYVFPVIDEVHQLQGLYWYTKEGNVETEFDFDTTITEDITLFAKWEKAHYVYIYANETDEDPIHQIKFFAGDVLTEADFGGIDTKGLVYRDGKEKGQPFGELPQTMEGGCKKLIGAPIYTVEFEGNGETDGNMDDQAFKSGEEQALTANAFEKTGYTFTGWNTAANGSGTAYEDTQLLSGLTENLTLYAQWKAHTYKVRFIRGGGTGSMADQEFTYGVEQELRENTFTREDYEFSHWEDDAGTNYEDKAVVQNLTAEDNGIVELVAVWKMKQNVSDIELDITFVPDNGSEVFTRTTGFDGKLKAEDIPDDPVKEGYTFGGWYVVEGAGSPVPEEPGIDPVTLTGKFERAVCLKAKWTANTYTVKFEGNGETDGNMDDQAFKSGEEQALTANAFEKTGYTFTGWNTAANGGGTAYEDKQLLSGLTENLTLYAQWSPISYTISYFDEDGSTPLTTTNPTAYTVESDNITLVNPTRDGYTFAGWTGTDLTGPAKEVIIAQGSTGNRAYTATWTKNVITCTVSFDANGGTGTMDSITVNKGADYILPRNGFTAPAGKTFKCWTIGRARANYQPGDTIKIEGDTVITANWESKTTDSDLDYVPAAGDNFPIFLWAGLLLFSVVALVEVVVLRRKRN